VHLRRRGRRLERDEWLARYITVLGAGRHQPRIAGLELDALAFELELGAAFQHIADRLVFAP
jgi:hypothetical protein